MLFKTIDLAAAELKFRDDDRKFSGYASVFGGVDAYGDTIQKGAYEETLRGRERPIRMRWNHYGPVIGKWDRIEEDDKGLWVEGSLTPGHSVAEDAYASLKHGAVDGMSIGYVVRGYEEDEDIRTLTKIDLVEISVVEEPADLGAKVGEVKNLQELIGQIESWKEAEAVLRDAGGFSRATATALVSRIKSLALGDREAEKSHGEILASALLKPIRNK